MKYCVCIHIHIFLCRQRRRKKKHVGQKYELTNLGGKSTHLPCALTFSEGQSFQIAKLGRVLCSLYFVVETVPDFEL